MVNIDKEDLKETINSLKNNKENSFKKLYENYNKLIFKIAFTILKNKEDSEDVVQIVFSKIYKMDKSKLPNKNEASWLYTVTKNESITLLRKKTNMIDIDLIYDIEDTNNEIDNIVNNYSYNKLIEKLNDKEKEIVSLKIIGNLSFKDIANILNEPIATIKWRYYKAVHTLKILLTNLGMFIITFFIGVKTLLVPKNAANMDTELTNSTVDYADDNTIKGDGEFENNNENEERQNTTQEKVENIINEIHEESIDKETIVTEQVVNINYYSIAILSFSAVFLIITIIFSIYLTKYQLKRKKKTSK